MADAVGSALLKQMYAFTLNLLRKYTIDHIEEGDVALDQLRTQISTEFEKLKASIESLRLAKLKTSQQNLADAMIYLESGLLEQAREDFRSARQNSIEAFTTAVNFDGKVLATKIRLLSLFHLEGYFISSTPNIPALEALCRQALQPLFESAEVQSAITHHSGGLFGFGQREGKRVLAEVSALRYTVTVRLSSTGRFPLLISSGEELVLHDVVMKEIAVHAWCLVLSEDKLFGGTEDGVIRVWDLSTLTELHALRGHSGRVNCLVISKGKLYSGSNDGTIRVWDLHSHVGVDCSAYHSEVKCLAVSGDRLYSGGVDGAIRILDIHTLNMMLTVPCYSGTVQRLIAAPNEIYWILQLENNVKAGELDTLERRYGRMFDAHDIGHMICSGNRMYTASRDEDYPIRVWDLADDDCPEIACLRGHNKFVTCLAVFGNRLYSGGDDCTVRIWDLGSFTEISCIRMPKPVVDIQISAGKMCVAMSGKILVRLI